MVPPKWKGKHIIKNKEEETENEQDDEPSVLIFPSKGKEKVLIDEDSEEDQDAIDAKIEATAIRATRTAEAKKSLLDIIVEITSKEITTATLPATTTQDLPIKSPSQTQRHPPNIKGHNPIEMLQ